MEIFWVKVSTEPKRSIYNIHPFLHNILHPKECGRVYFPYANSNHNMIGEFDNAEMLFSFILRQRIKNLSLSLSLSL